MRSRWGHWLVWAVATALTTAALLWLRDRLEKTHVALLYLLLVLAGSVAGGRRMGLALAGAAFVLFNWFFLPPYETLHLANRLDWLVLVTFLVVGAVAAQIVHQLQVQAEEARRRAEEVKRLAALGAETLNLPRSTDALAAITSVIRSTLRVGQATVHELTAARPAPDLVAWVEQAGEPAVRLGDGTSRLTALADAADADVRALLLPLRVRGRIVGVLELASDEPIRLDAGQRDFLAALSYYAALGVERSRLEAEAARADELRRADEVKDALLASVSHDLRTPLTTIKALAAELADSGDDRALTITEEVDRLNRFVADLLDLSRLRGGALPVRIELNAADDAVGAALQRIDGRLGSRRLAVRLADGGSLLVGRFDLVLTVRVLVNLLENAIKYAPADQPIDLAVDQQGAELRFEVADRGPGVASEDRDRIFEPFYRRSTGAPDPEGSGLGLAIAKSLAEAQGGELRYQPREGGGSRFILSLPAGRLDRSGELL